MGIPRKQTIERVENELKKDIYWTITEGPGWAGSMGNNFDEACGKWDTDCPVCAIGAFVAHRQPALARHDGLTNDVASAAKALKVDATWLNDVYQAVGDFHHVKPARVDAVSNAVTSRPYEPSALELARRLTKFALCVKDAKKAGKLKNAPNSE